MTTAQHAFDQGGQFALWDDPVADLIYRGAMPYLLNGIPIGEEVVDLGGGNGAIRDWLPTYSHLTTVDTDADKDPDVVADILTWTPESTYGEDPFHTGLLRYVLHYLTDAHVHTLLDHVATYLQSLVVIQFANVSTADKAEASADSALKVWRTPLHLLNLLEVGPFSIARTNRLDFTVTPDFYAHRLGTPSERPHAETLLGVHLVLDPDKMEEWG